MAVEGDSAYIDYGEHPQVIHARIPACHVHDDLWTIITPDFDVYEEVISAGNGDAVSVTLGQGGLGSPIPSAHSSCSLSLQLPANDRPTVSTFDG